ncbi:MAG: hypothetical protein QF437_23635, partial [Planctomycetota bacterium]|nr:hypothetical protein [Planctomycetota bacterium]
SFIADHSSKAAASAGFHLTARDGEFLARLAREGQLLVHSLDTDAKGVSQTRALLARQHGLPAKRVRDDVPQTAARHQLRSKCSVQWV